MKFGQDFQAALNRDEFPQEWLDSAISYKKLKKCIKQVQQELLGLGLDQETLNSLWQHVSTSSKATEEGKEPAQALHYTLNGSEHVPFTPRLTIAIDPEDGSPVDAWLSPETRNYLKRLARPSRRGSSTSPVRDDEISNLADGLHRAAAINDMASPDPGGPAERNDLETVEVPLTSDSEFFQILRRELKTLDRLQQKEQAHLQSEIEELGHNLRGLQVSSKKRSKAELDAWRKVFELYADAEIFFSSHEQDAGPRDVEAAQRQFEYFLKTLNVQRVQKQIVLNKQANTAVERFIHINAHLIRLMRFQDINRTALTKIMKKFDKQTNLRARAALTDSFAQKSPVTQDLARATSYTINNELLDIIPQLNDYLCPICFSVSYKPVRLSCSHVYCIRCLIVMQNQQQNDCPLCRAPAVLAADSDNIDKSLKHFLEKHFKSEVKEKQKANELAVAIERFGHTYSQETKCAVM